jgi:hypothetical protein
MTGRRRHAADSAPGVTRTLLLGGVVTDGVLKAPMGLRRDPEVAHGGADRNRHKISAQPDREVSW